MFEAFSFFEKFRTDFPNMSAWSLIASGFVVGAVLAWLYWKREVSHLKNRVDHLKEAIAGHAPASVALGADRVAARGRRLGPTIVIACLIGALVGAVIWIREGSGAGPVKVTKADPLPEAPQSASTASGNPLKDKIDALVAKRGKVANYAPGAGIVAMADASDGKGPFITKWNETSLGPWPTASDGFTEHELRHSPPSLAKNPIPDWGTGMGIGPDPKGITTFRVLDKTGRNLSSEEVHLKDAYLISGVTGERKDMKVMADSNTFVSISQIQPVPPGANVILRADFKEASGGIAEDEFMKTWGRTYFVAEYNDMKFRQTLDETFFSTAFNGAKPRPSVEPRVTTRK